MAQVLRDCKESSVAETQEAKRRVIGDETRAHDDGDHVRPGKPLERFLTLTLSEMECQ